MTRILADLSDDDVKWLDAKAAERGTSRAEILREAVRLFRGENSIDWLASGFCAWRRDEDQTGAEHPGA